MADCEECGRDRKWEGCAEDCDCSDCVNDRALDDDADAYFDYARD